MLISGDQIEVSGPSRNSSGYSDGVTSEQAGLGSKWTWVQSIPDDTEPLEPCYSKG